MDDGVRNLIQFLAEDCGWPLEEEQINRSAWPVNNSELGLNEDVSVDSVEVYELRPLTTNQPWGVFFLAVKGTSKLSIKLLRKLLRGLVKKKRASADTSNLQQWNLEDLMFVCSLDEPENTTRYFAHFKEQENGLPKLMIGARWQDSQPESEIKAAKLKIKTNLKWPDDEADVDSWREQWSKAFPVGHKEVIKTSSNLANALAEYALIIKRDIPDIYSIESENGPVHRLFEAFKEALINDLNVDDFADMVAQTITYGLFSARATGSELTGIEALSECIPSTNPFLRDLFSEFASLAGNEPTDLDFDDLSLHELVEMLNVCNIDAIMGEFGSQFKGGKEDPVIHFYETFLSEYDHQRRAERGVFYTPKSVVDFIVRSVHDSLIEDFDLPLGLADTSTHIVDGKEWPKVMILDPATGTGTFLEATIDIIHETMLHHWKGQGKSKSEISTLWNEYVDEYLLPRLYGFELMMAPYSIAHLKLGMKLIQTGYNSDSENRLNVYLTNTLVESAPLSSWIPDFISIETSNANSAKQDIPFSVVIGNPPYLASSANENTWIRNLMRTKLTDGADSYFKADGSDLGERNPRWINDDYVKFIRYGQHLLAKREFGILCYITNHGYLNNPTFRGVRQSISHTFPAYHILDLHGSTKRRESSSSSVDENVFDIMIGVCVGLFVRNKNDEKDRQISHLYGKRSEKYSVLSNNSMKSLTCEEINLSPPLYLFQVEDVEAKESYQYGLPLPLIIRNYGVGITTARDAFVVDMDEENLLSRVLSFANYNGSDEEACTQFGIRLKPGWNCNRARLEIRSLSEPEECLERITFRPFDNRWIFYHDGAVWRTVRKVMEQMIEIKNLAFITARSNKSSVMDHFFVTRFPTEVKTGESTTGSALFPTINKDFSSALNSSLTSIMERLFPSVIEVDIIHYIYAIMYSKSYREKYLEFLKLDFPRIQFTTNYLLFSRLSQLGADLVALHIMEDDYEFANWVKEGLQSPFKTLGCTFVEGNNMRMVGSMSKSKAFEGGDVFTDTDSITDCSKFSNVPEDVWNFTIGGYQVCHKWLYERRKIGNREGRTLTDEDILHYRRMIKSIECTLELMEHIDEAIEEHGGWPLEGSGEFNIPPDRDPGQMGLGDF